MHIFLGRDTRITVLEGPFTGQKGWVDSIVFKEPDVSQERAFCYQATLESEKWIKVHWDYVTLRWLSDDDLMWLLERLPKLTFVED
jgi:hypothetical protein